MLCLLSFTSNGSLSSPSNKLWISYFQITPKDNLIPCPAQSRVTVVLAFQQEKNVTGHVVPRILILNFTVVLKNALMKMTDFTEKHIYEHTVNTLLHVT